MGSLGDGLLADERFDGVLMLGNNLGLLTSPQIASSHLRWLADRCQPGALLVGEGRDPTKTTDPDHLAYHRRAAADGRAPGQTRLRVHFDGDHGDWFSYWLLTPEELDQAVRETPWQVESIAGGGNPFIATLRLDKTGEPPTAASVGGGAVSPTGSPSVESPYSAREHPRGLRGGHQ